MFAWHTRLFIIQPDRLSVLQPIQQERVLPVGQGNR